MPQINNSCLRFALESGSLSERKVLSMCGGSTGVWTINQTDGERANPWRKGQTPASHHPPSISLDAETGLSRFPLCCPANCYRGELSCSGKV